MNFLKYSTSLLAGIAMMACSEDRSFLPDTGSADNGDTFSVDVSFNAADMNRVASRSFSEAPDYQNLKLYVVEFDMKGGPLDGNVLSQVIEPECTVNNDGDKHFTLKLNKSEEPRVLHLIAVPESETLEIGYGLEGAVIPALTVSNGTDAYWQRLEFPVGYGKQNEEGEFIVNDDVKSKLTHVLMIRNFAKISVESKADGFALEGFALVNTAKKGTVAPWNSVDMEFPEFLNGKTMKLYSDIDYVGYFPGNDVEDVNTSVYESSFSTAVKYLYERPKTSINNTYIIIKGTRNGKSMYYKLDIGKNNNNNIFEYHNILRNFEYQVVINSVKSDGYDTLEEAVDGVVYNNFSFDVNTRGMLNISNGTAMIWVNKTTFVVNDGSKTTVDFQYRFDENISDNVYNTGNLKFIDPTTKEEITAGNISRLSDGVITSWTGNDSYNQKEGWGQIEMRTIAPTGNRRSYSFIVYDEGSGLGRTVEIVVRQPWVYSDLGVWGGNYNTRKQFISTNPSKDPWAGKVSSDGPGQPLTVVFTIENDIPESVFPLTFVLEAEMQNIENNKIGTLVVSSGKSFFDENKTTIKYVKTVSWAEYNTELSLKNITGTIVKDDNGKTQHRVRCRFLTINKIENSPERAIRIFNDYIMTRNDKGVYGKYGEVKFTGKDGEAPNWGIYDEDNIENSWTVKN